MEQSVADAENLLFKTTVSREHVCCAIRTVQCMRL